jgi:hypothetical protein
MRIRIRKRRRPLGLWLEIALGVFLGGVLLAHWRWVLAVVWCLVLTVTGLALIVGSYALMHGF